MQYSHILQLIPGISFPSGHFFFQILGKKDPFPKYVDKALSFSTGKFLSSGECSCRFSWHGKWIRWQQLVSFGRNRACSSTHACHDEYLLLEHKQKLLCIEITISVKMCSGWASGMFENFRPCTKIMLTCAKPS